MKPLRSAWGASEKTWSNQEKKLIAHLNYGNVLYKHSLYAMAVFKMHIIEQKNIPKLLVSRNISIQHEL